MAKDKSTTGLIAGRGWAGDRADDYVAAFIGGGAGSLFDVASDERVMAIMARIYEKGGVVGAGGHGPGSLGNVKLPNGQYLLPFKVEDRLRERGAKFLAKADLADKHDVVIDQRIVTTMFLPSSAIVAQEMVNLLR